MKVLHVETFDDHIPIYCELVFSNCAFTDTVNEITEVKFKIVWKEIPDDQLEEFGIIFINYSIDI